VTGVQTCALPISLLFAGQLKANTNSRTFKNGYGDGDSYGYGRGEGYGRGYGYG
jgi:hypothetical protein